MAKAELKSKVLHAAAEMFLSEGYTNTTVRGLAKKAGVDINAMIRVLGSKENILCHLVEYVLEGQFEAARTFTEGKTDDPVLYYAAETVLQLHMAESCEQIRDLYTAAYSMPESSALIMRNITGKLQQLFGGYRPDLETKDFFEYEIATGSIMRGYITIPCDMYFTMDRKVRRFIECTFRIFQVPEEKVEEAITFVSQFDYPMLAKQVVDGMIRKLSEADDI